jgi:hypothetical protein
MFKTLARVEAHFSQLLQKMAELKQNPDADDLRAATTSIYDFASDQERLDLTRGTLIPRAVTAVLSASLSAPSDDARSYPENVDTQTDMLVETGKFLGQWFIKHRLEQKPEKDTDGLHLSDALCAWMPEALSPDKLTIGKIRLLPAIAACSPYGFTQPVIDLCDQTYMGFVEAGAALLPPGHMPSEKDADTHHRLALFSTAQAQILQLQSRGERASQQAQAKAA